MDLHQVSTTLLVRFELFFLFGFQLLLLLWKTPVHSSDVDLVFLDTTLIELVAYAKNNILPFRDYKIIYINLQSLRSWMPAKIHAYEAKLNLKYSKLIGITTTQLEKQLSGLHIAGPGELFIGQFIKFIIVGPKFCSDLNDFVFNVLQLLTIR